MEKLVFNIWREGESYRLSDGEIEIAVATEAEAMRIAAEIADQMSLPYSLEFWKA